jgi:urea transporter
MLQENPITGIFFLVGISFGSFQMALAALLATATGTIAAKTLKYDEKEINAGLYGFSPALVGVALLLFLPSNFWVWLFVVLGSILAVVLQHFFIKKKISVFTLPFVVVTWCILYIFKNLILMPENIPGKSIEKLPEFFNFFRGYGQVIFQSGIFSGILFFIGVLINSPIKGIYGLLGGLLSGLICSFFPLPPEDLSLGLFSFNAVLCAIVFAGKKIKDILWTFVAIVISIVFSLIFYYFKLPQLTFPFVAASFFTLIVKSRLQNRI